MLIPNQGQQSEAEAVVKDKAEMLKSLYQVGM